MAVYCIVKPRVRRVVLVRLIGEDDKDFLVSESHRILKPSGIVICVNCDWDSVAYNGEKKELIAKAIHTYAVTKLPWMDDFDS